MIIKRELVQFGFLIENDQEMKQIVMHALRDYPIEERNRIIENFRFNILHNASMGSGFLHFDEIIEGCRLLDKIRPFDNGLTYRDVNNTWQLPVYDYDEEGKSESQIYIVLECKREGETHIVQIVNLTNTDGKVEASDNLDNLPAWEF